MELTEGDVFQSAIPYFTSTGVHTNPLACLAAGSHLVLEPEFDQHRTLPVADAFRSTVYLGAPSMLALAARRRPQSPPGILAAPGVRWFVMTATMLDGWPRRFRGVRSPTSTGRRRPDPAARSASRSTSWPRPVRSATGALAHGRRSRCTTTRAVGRSRVCSARSCCGRRRSCAATANRQGSRPRRRSPAVGFTPATSASSTRTGSSSTPTAGRTSSFGAG